ncbi:cobyric acid synthase [Lentisphaera profundi]|uniref:Cobyric acid synthase n=1 Tax=Lentisphaera profundi TaxID=1658616 RepID=A0ABY7VVM2_9BACT|nr:cobyric acid synthase [Lentisphaera profundi]WDE97951.1 cobyric acid synthase [Lentisphaera profundi]
MRNIAILGTASDVGKSLCTVALCRIFKRKGLNVSPYKAQNMSNNSYVTITGGEMGRAQVLQAEAAGQIPSVHMNPVLLKPSSEIAAQVILQGKVLSNQNASEYFNDTSAIRAKAYQSLALIQQKHEVIIIEGAGSCAEVNLRDRDFVNFDTAHEADADVYIVADINRGGVFAQIIGTMAILNKKDRARVKGFIINQFRGDINLFTDGVKYIEQQTKLPVLGVIPYLNKLELDCEDGLSPEIKIEPSEDLSPDKVTIAILLFPHLSNFSDFRVLDNDPQVQVHYLSKVCSLKDYDLIILPGSKNVPRDLVYAHEWSAELKSYQGKIFSICGGMQILGESIADPHGIEDKPSTHKGLGLIPLKTELHSTKITQQTSFNENIFNSKVSGYEIHHGHSQHTTNESSYFCEEIKDGIIHENIIGTYLHGVFDSSDFRKAFFRSIKPEYRTTPVSLDPIDRLADHFEKHLDLTKFR